jgi:hypothetical protein
MQFSKSAAQRRRTLLDAHQTFLFETDARQIETTNVTMIGSATTIHPSVIVQ